MDYAIVIRANNPDTPPALTRYNMTDTSNNTPDDGPRSIESIEAELAGLANEIDDGTLDDTPDDTPGDALDAAALAVEAEARRSGWVPKDEFNGPADKWVDAKTFVDRGQRFNKNLQRELEAVKRQLKEFEGTKAAFAKFHEETIAKKDAEIAEAIKALRVQRSEATADGDHEGAVALEDRIDLLRQQQKELKKVEDAPPAPKITATDPATNPVLEEWIEDGNGWFKDDPKLRDYSIKLGESMLAQGETLRGRKFLDKIAEEMREQFPRRFREAGAPTAPPKRGVESGSGGTRNAPRGGGKTEADLPAEDRALMVQFVKEGWTTKEKFLASYFSR